MQRAERNLSLLSDKLRGYRGRAGVLLFTGGLDSTVLLALLRKCEISFKLLYLLGGSSVDLLAARRIAAIFRTELIEYPLMKSVSELPPNMRLSAFVDAAASVAKYCGTTEIYVGLIKEDWLFGDLSFPYRVWKRSEGATEENRAGYLAPFWDLTKSDVAHLGRILKVPLQETWSCTSDARIQCLVCNACLERRAAFRTLAEQ